MVEPIANSDHRFASWPEWFSAHVNLWSEETEVSLSQHPGGRKEISAIFGDIFTYPSRERYLQAINIQHHNSDINNQALRFYLP